MKRAKFCSVCHKLLNIKNKSLLCNFHLREKYLKQYSEERKKNLKHCKSCDKFLRSNNKSGYCRTHLRFSPKERENRRKVSLRWFKNHPNYSKEYYHKVTKLKRLNDKERI